MVITDKPYYLSIIICLLQVNTLSPNNTAVMVTSSCECPDYTITYECTVVGGVSTVWRGSAVDCTNEIVLLHSRFMSGGDVRECNDGAIIGRSTTVENNDWYTSQLTVRISSTSVGKTILCSCDDGTSEHVVKSFMITDNFLTIATINVVENSLSHLFFSWSNQFNCTLNDYEILSVHCGSCPKATTQTAAKCTDVPADGGLCNFAVRPVICGDITGQWSDSVNVTLVKDHNKIIMIASYVGSVITFTVLCLCLLCTLRFIVKHRKTVLKMSSSNNQGLSSDLENSQPSGTRYNLPTSTFTLERFNTRYVPTCLSPSTTALCREYCDDVEMTTFSVSTNVMYEDVDLHPLDQATESTVNIHYACHMNTCDSQNPFT